MASALDNIKANLTKQAQPKPSLLDRALSFFGVSSTPPPTSTGTALGNIQKNLGITTPQVETAPTPPQVKINPPAPNSPEAQLLGTLADQNMATHQVVVQNPAPVKLGDIFKKSADIIKAVPQAIIQSETNPNAQELDLEHQAGFDLSNEHGLQKVVDYVPSLLAKGVFRFFAPIFQPYANDLADAIVSQDFAGQVADGSIPYSTFEKTFPALQKSNAQVIGDSIQAGLGVYLPNVFGEGVAQTAGAGINGALAQGLKTGAVSGGIFGTAQVLSAGTTDPKEIADIYAKNIIGGALLGAVTHAAIPLSKEAYTKATKDIVEKFDMPKDIYLDPQKVREVLSPTTKNAVDGIKAKVSPQEADLVRSLGMTDEQFAKAAKDGVTVSIPATKVIQITDKPYFAAIKDTFGFKPSADTINVKGEPHVTIGEKAPVSRETAPTPAGEPSPAPSEPTPPEAPQNAPEGTPAPEKTIQSTPEPALKVEGKGKYPTIHEGGVVRMVNGEPIHLVDGVDTFVHKDENGNWVVSEASTGRSLTSGGYADKNFAIKEARSTINQVGEEQFKKTIAEKKLQLPTAKKTQKQIVSEAVGENGSASIKEIAAKTKILEPNVRRILGTGAKEGTFERVDNGVYKLSHNGKDVAFIETANAVDALPRLAKDGFKADMIFLDIPYDTPAVKGGNRGVKYDLLSVKDFGTVMDSVSKIVKDEHTPVLYMYSQAVSGAKKMAEYNKVVLDAGFKPIAKGEWQKLFQNGLPVTNVRGKVAQPEGILLLTKSGKFDQKDVNLNFKLIRPKGYSTEKPEQMLSALIKTTTKNGQTVLDPFAGSGVTGAAAIKAGRRAYLIERNPEVVTKFTKPRLKEALASTVDVAQSYKTPERYVEEAPKPFHAVKVDDLQKIRDAGGKVVAPSIGITKNVEQPAEYGDVVLIPSDKLLNSVNFYTHDIWSPTHAALPETLYVPRRGSLYSEVASIMKREGFDLKEILKEAIQTDDPNRHIGIYLDNSAEAFNAMDALAKKYKLKGYDPNESNASSVIADSLVTKLEKTPENISKYMKTVYSGEGVRGVSSMFGGSQNAAEKFKYRDLAKHEKGLSKTSLNTDSLFTEQQNARYLLNDTIGRSNDLNGGGISDAGAGDLASAKTFASFENKLKDEYGVDPAKFDSAKLRGAYTALRDTYVNVPTDYFEGKSLGTHSINEFPAVITTNKEALALLKKMGYTGEVFKSYKDFYGKAASPVKKAPAAPVPEAKPAPEATPAPASETPATETKPTKVASDINKKIVEQGKTALTPEELSTYQTGSYKESDAKIAQMLTEDPAGITKMAITGKDIPEGVFPQMVLNSVEAYAEKNGDITTLMKLAKSPIGEARSKAAQELGSAGFAADTTSPVEVIRKVERARTKAVESKGEPVNKARTAIATEEKPKLNEALKKAAPKRQSWEDFIKSIEC